MKFREYLDEQNEYQDFFREKLKEYNVKSPSQLSKEDKVKFFKDIKNGWKKNKK